MARRSQVTATKTNYEDYLIDPSTINFEGLEKAEPEEPGFLSRLGHSGMALLEGLTMIPGGIADTVRDAWNGGDIDVTDMEAIERREAREREKAEYLRKYQGKAFTGLPEAMVSIPYSMTTMGASVAASAPLGFLTPAGTAAGMGASEAIAYRATKQDFLQRLLAESREALGRMPSQEEWDGIMEAFEGEATKYGGWEAIPEAIGNALLVRFLGPLGKSGGLWNTAKAAIKSMISEQATETATQWGQGGIEADMGWREKAPSLGEAALEQAPGTFWQTILFSGGKKAADYAYNKLAPQRNVILGAELAGKPVDLLEPKEGALGLPERGPYELPEGDGTIAQGMDGSGLGTFIARNDGSILKPDDENIYEIDRRGEAAQSPGNADAIIPVNESKITGTTSGQLIPDMDTHGGSGQSQQAYVQPQAMPTETQLTNTQVEPRADTQQMAENLGMPAPDAMEQTARPAEDTGYMRGLAGYAAPVQQPAMEIPVQPARPVMPPSNVGTNEGMAQTVSGDARDARIDLVQDDPRAVWENVINEDALNALPEDQLDMINRMFSKDRKDEPKGKEAPLRRTDRAALINSLPEEKRAQARRMTNQKLIELARKQEEELDAHLKSFVADSYIRNEMSINESYEAIREFARRHKMVVDEKGLWEKAVQANYGEVYDRMMEESRKGGAGLAERLKGIYDRRPNMMDGRQSETLRKFVDAVKAEERKQGNNEAEKRESHVDPPVVATLEGAGGKTEGNDRASLGDQYRRELPFVGSVKSGIIHKTDGMTAIEAAQRWVRENISSPVKTEIGEVTLGENEIRDSMSHGFSRPKIDAITVIEPVLRKGSYLGKLPDKNGKKIDNYYFAGRARFGEEEKIVFIRVRESEQHPKKFYVHEVFTEEDIKKAGMNLRATDQDQLFQNSADFYKNLIADYRDVNRKEDTGEESSVNEKEKGESDPESDEKPLEWWSRTELVAEAKKLGANAYILKKSKPDIANWIRSARKHRERKPLGKNSEGNEVFVNGHGRRIVRDQDGKEKAQNFTSSHEEKGENFQAGFASAEELYKDPEQRHFLTVGEIEKFGEIDEKRSRDYDNELPVVAKLESGLIKASGTAEAVREARKWFEQNSGDEIVQREPGEIIYDMQGIKNSLNHHFDQDKLDSIPAILPVLREGVYLGEVDDFDGKAIKNYYFTANIELGGKKKIVFVRTRKAAGSDNKFYVHEVYANDEIEKLAKTRGVTDNRHFQGLANFYKSLIADYLKVNEEQKRDETGEAEKFLKNHVIISSPKFYPSTVESGKPGNGDISKNALDKRGNKYGIPAERITRIDGEFSREQAMEALQNLAGKVLPNDIEGETAQVNRRQREKLASGKAVGKSIDNGFTSKEHFGLAEKIANAWKFSAKAGYAPSREKNAENVNFLRYAALANLEGRDAFVWLTVSETEEGKRIYSAELLNEEKLRLLADNPNHSDQYHPVRSFKEIIEALKGGVKPVKSGSDASQADSKPVESSQIKEASNGKTDDVQGRAGEHNQDGDGRSGSENVPGAGRRRTASGSDKVEGESRGGDVRVKHGADTAENGEDADGGSVPESAGKDGIAQYDPASGMGRGAGERDGVSGRERGGKGRGRGGILQDAVRGSGRTYLAPEGSLSREGSWKDTAERNLDIIGLVRKLDKERRDATPEEQALLAKYTGWGASEIRNNLFPVSYRSNEIMPELARPAWRPLVERALSLLNERELQAALQSTQYAHYTPEKVIRSIWKGIERMGFKGGKILEPGMGIGLFAIASPKKLISASTYTGVEMDPTTARIAHYLLPESSILNRDFVKQKFPDNFFDLAIGNPPFADIRITQDPAYKKHRFTLHDYFFAKSLDKVRPGGLLVFVTSKGTMDKKSDKARQFMAERADLLGAIRLPQSAFKENAGTDVVTDVLFLRKREDGQKTGGEDWLKLEEVKTSEGPTLVNEYFARHPEMVLGRHSLQDTMYGSDSYTVLPMEGDIGEHFAKAVEKLPENVYSGKTESASESMRRQTLEHDMDPKASMEGALYIDDQGNLRQLDNGVGVELTNLPKKSEKRDREGLKDYVDLKTALKQAQYDQLKNGDWEKSLKELNDLYDEFVKKHGPITGFTVQERKFVDEDGNETTVEIRKRKNEKLLNLDAESSLVSQLEQITRDDQIVKGPFLKGRTIGIRERAEIRDIKDALMVSLDERGELDLSHVAKLAKKPREEVIRELGDSIYRIPGGKWVMADEYLSGDVVTKLEEAEEAAKHDRSYERNVKALAGVQPKPLRYSDINVELGANWIPVEFLNQFAEEKLNHHYAGERITYNEATGSYSVPRSTQRSEVVNEYGTSDRTSYNLLDNVLNNRSVKITRKDPDGKSFTDEQATALANEKMNKIRAAFSEWIWQDAERASELLNIYNRKFNNIAPRKFDGSHLTLPGLSLKYQLYPHQKRAIWRIIQTGDTYLAHAVGAGKTLEMIVSGMEQKRLGLISRPLYIVPNHMLNQFASEFQQAYPLARLMVADESNFDRKKRNKFISQVALNAPDAVIMTHSSFGELDIRPETYEKITKRLMDELNEALEESKQNGDRISRSKLEKRLETLQRRLEARLAARDEHLLYFEDLGVDFLFVDEAHQFRKLDFITNRINVKGISPEGSQRALDLYSKLEWLAEQNPGRSHILASGTPITNTMAELYTLMRYMSPQILEQMGINTFDSWATLFGRVQAELEQNAAGKYTMVERFSKFVNLPELMSLVREFMDVLTMRQLGEYVQRPDLKGGTPNNIIVPASEDVKEYLKELNDRLERSKKFKPSKAQPGNPDPIMNIITDAKLAAIDMRFVKADLKNDPGSKLNVMIDDIIRTHREIADRAYSEDGREDPIKGGTQIVFSKDGFGENVSRTRGFDAKAWIMKRLKEAGIPAFEVAWMRDYKTHAQKEALFSAMREGRIRILFGTPENMGTGVNVQKRLCKLHYLSAPWYPADVEQPHGRILRQGNQNEEVEINWYATKGTYDSTTWGMIARKAKFIEQAFTGDPKLRSMEDISERSLYATAAALATGDERVIQLSGLEGDVERLTRLSQAHEEEQRDFLIKKRILQRRIEDSTARIERMREALKIAGSDYIAAHNFRAVINDAKYEKIGEAGEALLKEIRNRRDNWSPQKATSSITLKLGHVKKPECQIEVRLSYEPYSRGNEKKIVKSVILSIGKHEINVLNEDNFEELSGQGLMTRLVNRLNGLNEGVRKLEDEQLKNREDLKRVERRIGEPFPQGAELAEKIAELETLKQELSKDKDVVNNDEKTQVDDKRASIRPGEFLTSRKENLRGIRLAQAQGVVRALQERAKNAGNVKAVQGFSELPASVRKRFAEYRNELEGVYDPDTDTVWLVADNLESVTRCAEVWAHEQIVHHGLRGLLDAGEMKRTLNGLWISLGGVDNGLIRNIAQTYGLHPTTSENDRLLVMEETLANLAERRQAGLLDTRQEAMWRKIVAAIVRAWKKLVERVTGKTAHMGMEQADELLAALGDYVIHGSPEGLKGTGFFRAENVLPAIRKKAAPKKTRTAYKLFRVDSKRPGELFPLFVGANEAVRMGVWHDAEIGEATKEGKVKSKLGGLAMRPGWHAGDMPVATHIGAKKDAHDSAPGIRPDNQVWAEVEVADDVDWQSEANNRAQRNKAGKIIPRTAHITDRIPEDGMYRYKTNPNMTGTWIITGSMKVNRLLTDAEVAAINERDGVHDLPRERPFDFEKYGFEKPEEPLASLDRKEEGKTNSYGIPMERVTVIDRPFTREEARKALQELAGQDLPNLLEGLTAQVNRNQREKMTSGKAVSKSVSNGFTSGQHFNLASKIAELWKWAAEVGNFKDYKNRDGIEFRDFVSSVKVNGQDQFALLTTNETLDGIRLYSVELLNEKRLRLLLGSEANRSDGPVRNLDEILETLSSSVKPETRPLASLKLRDILHMGVRQAAHLAENEKEISWVVDKKDLSIWQNMLQLPHWIAKQFPKFASIYERQLKRMDERAQRLMKSLEEVPALFGKKRLGKEDKASLQKLIGKIDGKMFRFEKDKTVKKYISDGSFTNGRTKIKLNPAYYKEYEKALGKMNATENARKALLEIRKSLDQDFANACNQMSSMADVNDDMITKFRDTIGHVPNYFPHHRYGNWFVQAVDKNGNVVYREHFDALTQKQAKNKADEIRLKHGDEFPDAKWNGGKNEKLPDEVLGAPIDPEAMEQIIKVAASKIADKEQAAKISRLLCQSTSEVLKSRGWGSHTIGRKDIPGYETENIEKVIYDYKAGLYGWLSKMEAAKDFTRALGEIDAKKQPRLWKYASQYVEDMLRNADNIDRTVGNIKSVAFAWYLGANIKTAVVNATQNLIVGVPRLQMDVLGGGQLWLKGAMDSIANDMSGGKGRKLTDDERRMLQQLYGEKVITDAFMSEVRGHMTGLTGAGIWNRITDLLGKPMSVVERFNRSSLALAAYRAARLGELKERAKSKYGLKDRANHEQAMQFATDIVRDAHFVYGKSNMSEFMRSNTAGRIASAMYTFRTFSHNMINMWLWVLKNQGREGAIFTAKSLGATMALGGVTALPVYATLLALFQLVTGDDDDWTEELRKALPNDNLLRDVVCYGAPALAGVNLGGSLKMETPVTKGLAKGNSPEEVLTNSLGDIIGIPYDLAIQRPSRIMEAARADNWWRVVEEAVPTLVKNAMQGWRLYSEGQTSMKGKPINTPGESGARKLTGAEAIGKALGFQPVSSTKSYEAYAAQKRREEVRSDAIDKAAVLALKSRDTGEGKYQLEAMRLLRQWNENMKQEEKFSMMFNWKDVMRRVNARRGENSANPKERMKGAYQREVWGM